MNRLAPKARFKGETAVKLTNLPYETLPLLDFLAPLPAGQERFNLTESENYQVAKSTTSAQSIYDWVMDTGELITTHMHGRAVLALRDLDLFLHHCEIRDSLDIGLARIANLVNTYMPGHKAKEMWLKLIKHECFDKLSAASQQFVELYAYTAQRDSEKMAEIGLLLRQQAEASDYSQLQNDYLYTALLTALVVEGRLEEATEISREMPVSTPVPLNIQLLVAIADPQRFQ